MCCVAPLSLAWIIRALSCWPNHITARACPLIDEVPPIAFAIAIRRSAKHASPQSQRMLSSNDA
jgi:hypothetical protein